MSAIGHGHAQHPARRLIGAVGAAGAALGLAAGLVELTVGR